jgi:hypothetical protein
VAGRAKGRGRGGPAKGAGTPAAAGNVLALVHGATSRRVVDPIAAELVAEVLADPSTTYLDQPRYTAALRSWSRCEARVLLLAAALDRRGLEDADGNPSPWLAALERAEGAAERARSRLGLDPTSFARLAHDVAAARVDLARLWADDDDSDGGDPA